jgi:hypothetical protein
MTVNMLLPQSDRAPSRTVAEWLWPFVPMGVAAFSLSALVYYHLRQHVFEVRSPLQQLYAWLYRTIGFAPAVMLCGLVIVWSTIWLATGRLERPLSRVARLLALAVMLGIFLNLGDGDVEPALHKGQLGAWLADTLVGTFGYWPSLLVVWAMTFASLLLATDFFFHEGFERLRGTASRDAAARATESGVEPAVTEHLRGLAANVGPTPAAPGAAFVAAAVATMPDAVDDAPAIAPPAPAAREDESPRRRSYFERRAEREGRGRREEPTPEAQRGDDVELAEPERATGTDAPAAPAADADDFADERASVAATIPAAPGAERVVVLLGDDRVEELTVAPPPAPLPEPRAAADDELRIDEVELARPAEELYSPSRDEDLDRAAEALARVVGDAGRQAGPLDQTADEPDGAAERDEVGSREDDTVDATRDLDAAGGSDASDENDAIAAAPRDEALAAGRSDEPDVLLPHPRGERESAEPLVSIPRPPAAPEPEPRQQQLFGGGLDEALVQDAVDVVTGAGRASVALLQRKLRVDYALAHEVLAELAARGVVALEGDATTGRVLR